MFVTANIFQPLIDVFEAVLKFFHNSAGIPWGWSIVVLTIAIRVLLLPLTLKQFHSMQTLQRLQPELKALQAKYKEDKQRQQQELMKFYKENNVNPLGSCLPMVAQLPVMISLFYMLRRSLRVDICPKLQPFHLVAGKKVFDLSRTVACGPHGGAGFLFVSDLTNKATGAVLVVLILLYVGTQLGSSLLMSSPTMDKTQRQVMLFMPLLFVLFVIRFPAGVIIYWITTNTWTIAQQYVVKRRIGPVGAPAAAAGVLEVDGGGRAPRGPSAGRGGGSNGGSGGSGGGVVVEDGGQNGRSDEVSEVRPSSSPLSGLGGLLRARSKSGDSAGEAASARGSSRTVAPPPPPRKKKKRSGRRR